MTQIDEIAHSGIFAKAAAMAVCERVNFAQSTDSMARRVLMCCSSASERAGRITKSVESR